jgi:hypothetical protein
MYKTKDPYTFSRYANLQVGSTTIGSAELEYQVTLYDDLQVSDFTSVTQSKKRKYLVSCTQGVKIYNPDGTVLSPDQNLSSYNDYPAMLNSTISVQKANGIQFALLDYSPKTVNTQVQESGSTGNSSGQTTESSTSNTIGSSVSQTNSYSASVSTGSNFGSSAEFTHSTTVTNERSATNTAGRTASNNSDISNSASMSIKDWGGYALVDPNAMAPSFTFGQEYPWNAIDCRKTTGEPNPYNNDQVQVVVPSSMLLRLYDGVSLYPPSQLSMFGINFVMMSDWVIVIDDGTSEEVALNHVFNYFTASHMLATANGSDTVNVYLDKQPARLGSDESLSTTINLLLMALDPVNTNTAAAIIGFFPGKFIQAPSPATSGAAPVPFKVASTSNDLAIYDTSAYPSPCDAGAGFKSTELGLTAAFAANCTQLQMTMYFKVVDSTSDYSLYIKHWKTGDVGVKLTFVINGDSTNPIVQYVDAPLAEGGDANLLSAVLRSQNFTSVYFYDFLQLGLNSVQVTIEPIGGQYVSGSNYQVRAVSIEKS